MYHERQPTRFSTGKSASYSSMQSVDQLEAEECNVLKGKNSKQLKFERNDRRPRHYAIQIFYFQKAST